jgi:hypothetical protein
MQELTKSTKKKLQPGQSLSGPRSKLGISRIRSTIVLPTQQGFSVIMSINGHMPLFLLSSRLKIYESPTSLELTVSPSGATEFSTEGRWIDTALRACSDIRLITSLRSTDPSGARPSEPRRPRSSMIIAILKSAPLFTELHFTFL